MTAPKKTKTKKRDIDDRLRKFCRLSLEAAQIEYSIEEGNVIMKWDDVCRLVCEVAEQHHALHAVENRLRQIFPVIEVVDAVGRTCDDYHSRFPTSEALEAWQDQLRREQDAADRSRLLDILGLSVPPRANVDPSKAN